MLDKAVLDYPDSIHHVLIGSLANPLLNSLLSSFLKRKKHNKIKSEKVVMDIVLENNVKREEQEGKALRRLYIYYRNFYDVLKTSPRKWTIDNIRAHC
jgi:hypothetical protein